MSEHATPFSVSEGVPYPFGASPQEDGVNFAIFSRMAESVTLCFFDSLGKNPLYEIEVPHRTGDIWHIFVHQVPENLLYAYRIEGTDTKFKYNGYLVDPHAKAVGTPLGWGRYTRKNPYQPLGMIIKENTFDWDGVVPPRIPLKDLIIYEMHVRGFTNHSSSGVEKKGKFLGIVDKIPYLKDLGINAVKLLPIQEFNENENTRINPVTHQRLYNYWGYSTVNYYSPMNRYVAGAQAGAAVAEFKTMVREFHRNGIEVILDVVFNHTAEGDLEGPVYSFKGVDNAVYYILDHEGKYRDFTGCHNTFNCNHPIVREFIIDCLRYWTTEMHVDGFRFDLASIFYRGTHGDPMKSPPLVEAIAQDPVLSDIKLIAEPWDAAGLYQVGSYYSEEDRWSEWNGKYRDAIRRFIKGNPGEKREFAARLCGSQDLYWNGRSPCSSINFVTAHDGFTLNDLVSYNNKHNIENGEQNRDGLSQNDSWNCGVEGPTLDPGIISLRERQKRNFILGLMLSQGVPMIQMGDEYSHSRRGNNNSWCHDSELNWFLWEALENNKDFFRYYQGIIRFRHQHPFLRKGQFLTDSDIEWHGHEPNNPDWDGDTQFIAFTLKDQESHKDVFAAFNVHHQEVPLVLPAAPEGKKWHLVVNTGNQPPLEYYEDSKTSPVKENKLTMIGHSAILLKAK